MLLPLWPVREVVMLLPLGAGVGGGHGRWSCYCLYGPVREVVMLLPLGAGEGGGHATAFRGR